MAAEGREGCCMDLQCYCTQDDNYRVNLIIIMKEVPIRLPVKPFVFKVFAKLLRVLSVRLRESITGVPQLFTPPSVIYPRYLVSPSQINRDVNDFISLIKSHRFSRGIPKWVISQMA